MLDDYAGRWATMHADACEATRVRGEQPESVMQLRMSCLDSPAAASCGALTGMFAGADAAAGAEVDRRRRRRSRRCSAAPTWRR